MWSVAPVTFKSWLFLSITSYISCACPLEKIIELEGRITKLLQIREDAVLLHSMLAMVNSLDTTASVSDVAQTGSMAEAGCSILCLLDAFPTTDTWHLLEPLTGPLEGSKVADAPATLFIPWPNLTVFKFGMDARFWRTRMTVLCLYPLLFHLLHTWPCPSCHARPGWIHRATRALHLQHSCQRLHLCILLGGISAQLCHSVSHQLHWSWAILSEILEDQLLSRSQSYWHFTPSPQSGKRVPLCTDCDCPYRVLSCLGNTETGLKQAWKSVFISSPIQTL